MKKLTIILALILIGLLSERFLFHTVKINVEMDPSVLKASTSSRMTITIVSLNSLGFKTPFSKTEARFEIEEGTNLIEMEKFMENDKVIVHSKGLEGEAVIGIYSLKSGILLRKLLIKIVPGNFT
jgi:hypothetical protein